MNTHSTAIALRLMAIDDPTEFDLARLDDLKDDPVAQNDILWCLVRALQLLVKAYAR